MCAKLNSPCNVINITTNYGGDLDLTQSHAINLLHEHRYEYEVEILLWYNWSFLQLLFTNFLIETNELFEIVLSSEPLRQNWMQN